MRTSSHFKSQICQYEIYMNTTNAQHLPSIEEFKQQARELKKSQNFEKLGHAQNALAKEYGYKDLMIKRDEKFRYRNDLANRIFEIYESL